MPDEDRHPLGSIGTCPACGESVFAGAPHFCRGTNEHYQTTLDGNGEMVWQPVEHAWRKITDESSEREVIAAARAAVDDPEFPPDLHPALVVALAAYDEVFADLVEICRVVMTDYDDQDG